MNPILAVLNHSPQLSQANQILNSLKGRDPNAMMQELMQSNPQFKQFVQDNQGKSAEEIVRNYGINPAILDLLKSR